MRSGLGWKRGAQASVLALSAAALAACGGESGGTITSSAGQPIVVTPNFTVGAPAAGTLGAGSATPVATAGGPSLGGSGPPPTDGTAFALQQSAVTITSSTLTADTAVNTQGATVTITHASPLSLAISIPALAISALALTDAGAVAGSGAPSAEAYTASLSGGRTLELDARHLNYVNYGDWTISSGTGASGLTEAAAFISGYHAQNVSGGLIGSGATASYNGSAYGVVAVPNGTTWKSANLAGTAALVVDFGRNTLTGQITAVTATPTDGGAAEAWNTVNLTATLSGASFSGSTASASAPTTGAYGLAGTASGHLDGGFYGPQEQEAGAIWTLTDGTRSALGVLAGATTSTVTSNGAGGVTVTNSGGAVTSGGGIQAVASGSGGVTITLGNNGGGSTLGGAAAGTSGTVRFAGLESGAPVDASKTPAPNTVFSTIEATMLSSAQGAVSASPTPTITVVSVDPATGKATLSLDLAGFSPVTGPIVLTDLGQGPAGDTVPAELFSGQSNGKTVTLDFRHLDYTAFGVWSYDGNRTAWVTGYRTPTAAIPATGSASYSGSAYGTVMTTAGGTTPAKLAGDASVTVNFGSGAVTGLMTHMTATASGGVAMAWNDASLTATLSSGYFNGTTAVTTTPQGDYSLVGSGKGSVSGTFYGPTAEEVGATWNMSDLAGGRAVGVIGAKKP